MRKPSSTVLFCLGCLGCLLWLAADSAAAQPARSLDPARSLTQYQLDTWTTDHGLPQNSVSTIVQSRDGYLWLGTQEGLVRFDGTRFQIFDRRNGALRNNNVVALHEDRQGGLWIGTGGGVVHHARGRFEAFTKENGLSSNDVVALLEDRRGALWIGTTDGGVTRLDRGQVSYLTAKDGLASNAVSVLYEDRAGAVWIGTSGGLTRYDPAAAGGATFTTFTTADGLAGRDVTSLFEDRDGALWVGTRTGLSRFKDNRFTTFTKADGLPDASVLAVYQDGAGTLWVGTDHGGLSRLRTGGAGGTRFETLAMRDGLGSDVVRAVVEDHEGSLWIGTDGGGLGRLRNGAFTTYTTAEGLAHNFVYALYEDPAGALWIGTDGGVSRLKDGKFATYTTEHGLSSNYVLSVYGSRDGSLWVGTYGAGLNRLQGGTFTTLTTKDGLPSDEVYALFEDAKGTLWIGTRFGLGRYRGDSLTTFTTRQGLSSNDITSMAEDAEGRLWVGTYDGGLNVLEGDAVVRRYTKKEGLLSDHVLTLYADAGGDVWIGTREGGLNRFRPDADGGGSFTAVAPEQGLASDNVFQIVEDERGNLWMTCNQSLFRVSKAEVDAFAEGRVERVTSVVYDRHDGLRTTEFNGGFQPAGWRGRDGRLWFPSDKGLVSVDAGHGPTGLVPPRVLVERVTADEAAVDLAAARIEIPAGASKFEFDYVAVTFLSADKVQYRYRLEGVDTDWVYAGSRREAYYTNLPPGAYTFQVAAAGSDGVWNEAPTVVTFYLKPFFFETPLFMLLCALVFGFTGFGAYRLRVQHLQARHKELLRLVHEHTRSLREEKEKTEEALREAERQQVIAQEARAVIEEQAAQVRELDRLKTRFFSNISHEFRTPLTLTIGPLENALTGAYGPVGGPLRGQLELMLRNARRLLRLINQLLDLAKLDSGRMTLAVRRGNVVPLLEGVVLSFTAFAEEKELRLSFTADEDALSLDFDPECLEKVFFNLLSNAVKFTPRGGQVKVECRRAQGERVEIRVHDSGVGIPAEELPHVFDRFHQVESTVTQAGEGTGIGLSLVKELVTLHGGTIQAESTPGAGSTFTVLLPETLPHAEAAVPASWEPAAPRLSRGPLVEMAVFDTGLAGDDDAMKGDGFEQAADFSFIEGDGFDLHGDAFGQAPGAPDAAARATILVVDDNPDVCAYVSASLSGFYRIATAGDGREALARAREVVPDLVISDVMMPHMDGYGLCRALRADERLRAVPVILLTARAGQDDRIEGLEAGSTDYIAKPFNTPELLARVRNLLALREQQKELERLNGTLEAQNEALVEASEMKSQLLHIAAHDMKNPLSAIREFARLLKKEVGRDSHIFDPLDLIDKSSDQMLHLVTSLLDSAAIESGQIILHMEPVNLNTLAASIVRRNRPMAEQKAQQLVLNVSEDRCLVQGDKDRLLEAMDNLVNNAVKYSPRGKTIWVTVERAEKAVRFEVRDEGPGLTDDDRRKLFSRFQRLSAQPTGGETSTGLGLAIVKQLTELHDGRVLVESKAGHGSTFTIELPTMTETPAAVAPA